MNLRWLAVLLVLSLPRLGYAIEFTATNTFELAETQTLTNEIWTQAHTITLAGTANEDCFLLANSMGQHPTTNIPTLRLSGLFKADIWGLGETIEVTGPVARHTRLAALKTIMLNSRIGRNLMAFAPTISLGEASLVSGSSILGGQDIILNGTIKGVTRVFGNKVTLTGTFEDDLHVSANEITVMPGTRIHGNFHYQMDGDLVLDSGVALEGRMIKEEAVIPPPTRPSSSLMVQLSLLCGAILAGMAFVSLMPGVTALSIHKLTESTWRCLLFGFITFALVPLIAVFLVLTVAGIPLSLILLMTYLILLYVSKIIVGLFVGHLIIRKNAPVPANLLFPVMALGLLVLYATTNLPFPFDIIFWFAITLSGMGALVSAILDRRTPILVTCSTKGGSKPPPLPGATPPGTV